MLQRSPGYIFPLPSHSLFTTIIFTLLPASIAYFFNRLLWLFKSYMTNFFCKTYPGLAKRVIRSVTIKQLPPNVSWDPHFKPRYNPWDQRFCASLNGDFFAAIRSGKADIVTDRIKTVTARTIELESGNTLHPDAIVTATGLKLRFGGGITFKVNDKVIDVSDQYAWRTVMLQDVPNLFFIFGYETASWTLGADVAARLFVRICNRMKNCSYTVVVPHLDPTKKMPVKSMMSLSSTYLKNAGSVLPKGGSGQWSPKSNYFLDMAGAKWGDITSDLRYS